MDLKRASLRKTAILVSSYLAENNVETVLTGGACVSLYTRNKYLSFDLDLVLLNDPTRRRAARLMEAAGFQPDGRHFRHPDSHFIVEFLSPPLSVGEEPITHVGEIRDGKKVLKLLSPTDCVKDRLAAYFYWDDYQALEQAVLVAKRNPVRLKDIERWSGREGMILKFRKFMRELKARPRLRPN